MSAPYRHHDVSVSVKETFQVVALIATVMVVGIHYKSAVPLSAEAADATWNALTQDFLFGGIARVAVPLFAFAAGFFYYRSDDGTWGCYLKKLGQRGRSVGLPYFIVASVAIFAWLMIRRLTNDPANMNWPQFVATWWLHPPAEQLWFLRDLLVLVLIAPVIRFALGASGLRAAVVILILGGAWFLQWEPFPILVGWHFLHIETLFFFALGAVATRYPDWLESICRISTVGVCGLLGLWGVLLLLRINLRADFDLWYSDSYGWLDLFAHKTAILVGGVALFGVAYRLRYPILMRLSGAAFFVYLVHEFPLRAILVRGADQVVPHPYTCWVLTPLVVVGCFVAAVLTTRYFPLAMQTLSGGRVPSVGKRSLPKRSAQANSPA
ncbi:Acyltransferase family protein [Roseimaritima multifibrata]|uniref:Acyltransferase family protein n=1 Tax=Roseimaritima multifibrata TaxID=1930274 RepID=A0A517MK92_9BACT|nr:acyltransferase [Roseimaritima multifibrata]QDS95207.1 Acyltransferase family protein [Roseimaritima multifibrata]